MFRYIVILLLSISTSIAGDYPPYVRVHNVSSKELIWSGVVIKDDEGNILTVGHPFFGLPMDQIEMEVELEQKGKPKVSLPAKLIKYDYHRDLGLLKVDNITDFADPVELADSKPDTGSSCVCLGYHGTEPMREERCSILSFTDYMSKNNNAQTTFRGRAIVGLSGCPIMHNNKILSIQSGGMDGMSTIIGSDIDEIKFFLSEEWE